MAKLVNHTEEARGTLRSCVHCGQHTGELLHKVQPPLWGFDMGPVHYWEHEKCGARAEEEARLEVERLSVGRQA